MSSSFDETGSWDRVAAELRACKESQKLAYGDVDNATLGRYLAGDLNPAEMATLEQTLDELPELRKLTDLVQDVLRDLEPIESAPPTLPEVAVTPVILPLPAARPRRSSKLRRYGSLAAACLLFGCVTLLPVTGGRLTSPQPEESLTLGAGMAAHQMVWLWAPPPREDAALAEVVQVAADAPRAVPATAEQVNHTVANYHRQGDVAGAEKTLRQCMSKHGPAHEAARSAGWQLAGVYQYALNESSDTAPKLNPWTQQKGAQSRARDTARQVREQIVNRSAPSVSAEVVPVLNEALKKAKSKSERLALIKALGEIGPAAKSDSVALLCERLKKADDEERLAVLDALERMGPAARGAVPTLHWLAKAPPAAKTTTSEKSDAESRGQPTPKERAGQVLARLTGSESRVGVFDGAGLFSLKRSMEVTCALRKLARESDLEVRVETHCGEKPATPSTPMGRNSLRVVITSGGDAVRVVATPALREQGLDVGRLQKTLAHGCKDDQALDAVLAVVKQARK